MTEPLQHTLRTLLDSGTTANPALNALLDDYTKYHVVLVALGSAFVGCFALLALFSWKRYRQAPRSSDRRWTFERKTYLFFGISSLCLGALMALIAAANLSNVLAPRNGFSGVVGMVGTPRPGSSAARLHESFSTWLQSGSSETPALVRSSIDDRLAWQRPKAIICGILLIAFVSLGARLWRRLIRASRTRQGAWSPKDRVLLGAGIGTGVASLLLMVMVIGNTQGSIAPLSLTLLFG